MSRKQRRINRNNATNNTSSTSSSSSSRDEVVPPLKLVRQSSSDLTDSNSESQWTKAYEAPPLIEASSVLWMGVILTLLAKIWPPLIFILSICVAKWSAYCFRVNDDSSKRRQLFAEFAQSARNLPEDFRNIPSYIQLEESYWSNARGMLLCTSIMTPTHMPVQAVVCYCHGYGDSNSFEKRVDLQRLVKKGIAVVTIEYEGHGRSDGPLALIGNWDYLIDDVSTYFPHITKQRFPNKPVFLMGESMGGAVAFDTYNKCPSTFSGVVFIAPMCKISEDMLPPPFVVNLLRWLIGPKSQVSSDSYLSHSVSFLGYLPLSPAKRVGSVSHRDSQKYDMGMRCPLIFDRSVRLATARELIDASSRISNSLADFDAPFLVLHGDADRVTDPALSKALYDESKSDDKTIRMYEGMWHALISGEPDDSSDRVMSDIQKWILNRTPTCKKY